MLVRGSLFAGPLNDTKIYSYGGSDTYENVSFPGWVGPTSDQYPLWSYEYSDAAWKSYDLSGSGVIRPSSGATAEARDQGLAFWYNGQLDSGSSTETQPLGDIIQFIKGMVVIDFNTGLARNLSTDAVSDQPRVRGKMVYVPGIGEKGALVLIGGGEKGYLYENSDRYGTPVSLDWLNNVGLWLTRVLRWRWIKFTCLILRLCMMRLSQTEPGISKRQLELSRKPDLITVWYWFPHRTDLVITCMRPSPPTIESQ